jgi:hypothetical protein
MIFSTSRSLAFGALTIALLLLGCSKKSSSNVSGKVTYDGQPLESGFISFYPEEGQGSTVGGEIVKGSYSVKGVAPGKNRVQITVNEAVKKSDVSRGKSRGEANAERLSKIKERKPKMQAAAAHEVEGSERVVEIPAGTHHYDIELKKAAAQK